MLNNIQVNSEKDKILAQKIIDLFLDNQNYDEIARQINENVEFVKMLLNYRKMIISNFDDNVWKAITERKCVLEKIEKEKRKEMEYEQTMSKILYYMTNSLYSIDEIAQLIFISSNKILKMIADTNYIEEKFGKQMVENLKKWTDIRKKYTKSIKNGLSLVKNPKYRNLIYSDIITVTDYEYSLIEKVYLFFEYNGDAQAMAINTQFSLNTIIASLNDTCLKDILLESVYKKLRMLLEVDSILTQNRLVERKLLIENVISIMYALQGDIESVIEMLEYPSGVVERIINHPITPMICKELGIDIESIEWNKNNDEKQKIK